MSGVLAVYAKDSTVLFDGRAGAAVSCGAAAGLHAAPSARAAAARSGRSAARRATEPTHEVFARAADHTTDPYWQKVFLDMSAGKMPKGFRYSQTSSAEGSGSTGEVGRLVYKAKAREISASVPADPEQALADIRSFFNRKLNIMSERDRDLAGAEYAEETTIADDIESGAVSCWSKVGSESTRAAMISDFVNARARDLSLTPPAAADLKRTLNIGLWGLRAAPEAVVLEDGMITGIRGVSRDLETGEFFILPSARITRRAGGRGCATAASAFIEAASSTARPRVAADVLAFSLGDSEDSTDPKPADRKIVASHAVAAVKPRIEARLAAGLATVTCRPAQAAPERERCRAVAANLRDMFFVNSVVVAVCAAVGFAQTAGEEPEDRLDAAVAAGESVFKKICDLNSEIDAEILSRPEYTRRALEASAVPAETLGVVAAFADSPKAEADMPQQTVEFVDWALGAAGVADQKRVRTMALTAAAKALVEAAAEVRSSGTVPADAPASSRGSVLAPERRWGKFMEEKMKRHSDEILTASRAHCAKAQKGDAPARPIQDLPDLSD